MNKFQTLTFTTRVSLIVMLGTAISCFALAQNMASRECSIGTFYTEPLQSFGLAQVKFTKAGTRFLKDVSDATYCPDDLNRCGRKTYLLPKDVVLISRNFKGSAATFSCGYYSKKNGSLTAGWLRADTLEKIKPKTSNWVGSWDSKLADLEIKTEKGAYHVTGNATYPTLAGSVNYGELDFITKPKSGMLEYKDEFCSVQFRLLSPYLIGRDNTGCGGHNVTFSAVYQK
jgi:hypothetical protein